MKPAPPSTIPWFVWVIWISIAVFLISHAIRMFRRKRHFQVLAAKFNLKAWGDGSLPGDLFIENLPLAPISRVFNVYEGTVNNVQVAVFDVAKRAGKSTIYFTVIAAHTHDAFDAQAFDSKLETSRCGDWTLLYYHPPGLHFISRRLLSMDEIDDHLTSIRVSPRQVR